MEKKLPLVSIVIPTYNHAKYLKQAIDSVLSQDYARVELIVLDDGSTDETRLVLDSYGNQFYWESHQNIGQPLTLNKGWNISKGQFLAYLSADDVLLPSAVSSAVECLISNPDAVMCYCDFDLIDPFSKVIRNITFPEYGYLNMLKTFTCPVGPGAFFLRDGFIKVGGWDPNIYLFPDFNFWLRLGLHGNFVHIKKTLARFRVHEGSQTFSIVASDRAKEAIKVLEGLYSLPDLSDDILRVKSQAIGNAHLLVAQLDLRAGRYLYAFREICNCGRLSPTSLISLRFARIFLNGFFNRFFHKLLWEIRKFKL